MSDCLVQPSLVQLRRSPHGGAAQLPRPWSASPERTKLPPQGPANGPERPGRRARTPVAAPEDAIQLLSYHLTPLVWGGIPLGALVGGVLADATSVPTVFAVAGAAELVLAGVLWRLLVAHRDLVAGAFRTEQPARDG